MFQDRDFDRKISNVVQEAQTAPLPQYQKTHTNQYVK